MKVTRWISTEAYYVITGENHLCFGCVPTVTVKNGDCLKGDTHNCLEHNMATSDEASDCKLPLGFTGEVLAMVSYTSLGIIGSLGNIFVILAIYRTPTLRNVCGILIANVAVSDLIMTAVVMPLVVFILIQGFLDKCMYQTPIFVAFIIALFSAGSSLLTLTNLSVDRCFAICRPMKHKTIVTLTKAKILIAKTWIESLILPILVTFYRESTIAKFLQTIGVVYCYSIIVISGIFTIRYVRASSRQIRSLHQDQGASRLTADLTQRNKQVAKTIALVVFLFTLCWIPIAFIIGIEIDADRNGRIYFWFATLGLANSTVNPWIYFYRQPNYRKALKSLLGCKQGTSNAVVQVQNRNATQGTQLTRWNKRRCLVYTLQLKRSTSHFVINNFREEGLPKGNTWSDIISFRTLISFLRDNILKVFWEVTSHPELKNTEQLNGED